jgi:hypothetical protein
VAVGTGTRDARDRRRTTLGPLLATAPTAHNVVKLGMIAHWTLQALIGSFIAFCAMGLTLNAAWWQIWVACLACYLVGVWFGEGYIRQQARQNAARWHQ